MIAHREILSLVDLFQSTLLLCANTPNLSGTLLESCRVHIVAMLGELRFLALESLITPGELSVMMAPACLRCDTHTRMTVVLADLVALDRSEKFILCIINDTYRHRFCSSGTNPRCQISASERHPPCHLHHSWKSTLYCFKRCFSYVFSCSTGSFTGCVVLLGGYNFAHVFDPTIPSVTRPDFFWNAMTAATIFGPKIPSAVMPGDRWSCFHLFCIVYQASSEAPSRSCRGYQYGAYFCMAALRAPKEEADVARKD